MLVQTTFFGAYGIGALTYYIYANIKTDILNQIGYKNGILIGLGLASIGSALFYPISFSNNYYIYLIPLFIIGIGFTILQIACNPYVTLLGDKTNASSRLNLAQGINSLGTTLAPIIGAYFLLAGKNETQEVGGPFLILAGLFMVTMVFIYFQSLPEYKNIEAITKVNLFKYPQVTMGMVAIFLYVGAEVAIGSKLIEYFQLESIAGLGDDAGAYVGVYWGGAMIGRLASAFIFNQNLSMSKRILYSIGSTLLTIVIILIAIYMTKELTIYDIYPLLFFIPIQFISLLKFKDSNGKVLSLFAIIIISLLIIAFIFEGKTAMWSIIAIGLFNSIMWSNIFTLSIANLGNKTAKASSLLIIMIIGGAVLPLLMGVVSDKFNLKIAYLIPIIAYLYISYFGLKITKLTPSAEQQNKI
jgi:FHS family L-fucose permease-like MFS transporter